MQQHGQHHRNESNVGYPRFYQSASLHLSKCPCQYSWFSLVVYLCLWVAAAVKLAFQTISSQNLYQARFASKDAAANLPYLFLWRIFQNLDFQTIFSSNILIVGDIAKTFALFELLLLSSTLASTVRQHKLLHIASHLLPSVLVLLLFAKSKFQCLKCQTLLHDGCIVV